MTALARRSSMTAAFISRSARTVTVDSAKLLQPRAQESFGRLAIGCLTRAFSVEGVTAQVQQVPQFPKPQRRSQEGLILTISTPEFRLLLSILWTDSDVLRAYVARMARRDEPLDDFMLRDFMAETWNQCCGMLNRELVPHFPHIGMSTPARLLCGALEHQNAMGCSLLRDFEIRCDQALFHSRLTAQAFGPLNFDARMPISEDTVECSGELELL